MTKQELIDYGFRPYQPNLQFRDRFDEGWQFCQRDGLGKKFFVNIQFWDFAKYSNSIHTVDSGWDAWVQFDMYGHRTYNVHLNSVRDMTPAEVVDWFENIWIKMRAVYYERYDHAGHYDQQVSVSQKAS